MKNIFLIFALLMVVLTYGQNDKKDSPYSDFQIGALIEHDASHWTFYDGSDAYGNSVSTTDFGYFSTVIGGFINYKNLSVMAGGTNDRFKTNMTYHIPAGFYLGVEYNTIKVIDYDSYDLNYEYSNTWATTGDVIGGIEGIWGNRVRYNLGGSIGLRRIDDMTYIEGDTYYYHYYEDYFDPNVRTRSVTYNDYKTSYYWGAEFGLEWLPHPRKNRKRSIDVYTKIKVGGQIDPEVNTMIEVEEWVPGNVRFRQNVNKYYKGGFDIGIVFGLKWYLNV